MSMSRPIASPLGRPLTDIRAGAAYVAMPATFHSTSAGKHALLWVWSAPESATTVQGLASRNAGLWVVVPLKAGKREAPIPAPQSTGAAPHGQVSHFQDCPAQRKAVVAAYTHARDPRSTHAGVHSREHHAGSASSVQWSIAARNETERLHEASGTV